MKEEIQRPFPGEQCFFCGSANEHGLHLRFFHDAALGETSTEYVPEARFLGQGDILHGAIQMGLLDEIMGWASYVHTREMAVTTRLEARFLRPLHVDGTPVGVRCRVTGREGRDILMRAELVDAGGTVCTTAEGTYRVIPAERFAALVQRTGA